MGSERQPRVALFEDVHRPPDDLLARAVRAEGLGIEELWLAEDCFLVGGVAGAAAVLAATDRLRVGLGILPAVTRNPSTTAMELATLERLFPGRVIGGIGHGVPAWMAQIGATSRSALEALESTIVAVRRLLRGETVTVSSGHWLLDEVALAYPPRVAPPVYAGVRGPRSVAVSARTADGTLLSDWAAPAYVRGVAAALREAGASASHQLGVIVRVAVDDDRRRARDEIRAALRPHLARDDLRVLFEPLADEYELDVDRPGDDLIDQLSLTGDEDSVLRGLERYEQAGADLVLLRPVPSQGEGADRLHRLCARLQQHHDREHLQGGN
jgi:5,10-methylenetetrahydromethanopterin reductase